MSWSEDDHARLREMWTAGMTASVIAAKMGKSRSAILGKARRLNLEERGMPETIARKIDSGPGSRSIETAVKLVADDGLTVEQAARRIVQPVDRIQRAFAKLRKQFDMGHPATVEDDTARGTVKPLRPIAEIDRDIAAGRFK